jgi:uncharacterized protein (DUF1697 family)
MRVAPASNTPLYIALLRAVNVAGHGMVAMSDLRGLLTWLGCDDVQSVLQSGNLVFRSPRKTGASFERSFELETEKQLELHAEFFVRDAEEWAAVLAGNPFREQAERDPGHLIVTFFKDAPSGTAVQALEAAITGREFLHADGRHAYIVYPDGVGRSKLTTALIEKTLGTRTTGRNWNTVRRIGALAGLV